MNSKPLKGLVFNLAKPKPKRVSKGKVLTRKLMCICTKTEDGQFKANLRIVSNTKRVTNILIPFTPASHSCKGKERVFTKKLDKHGKRICRIRNHEQAMFAPAKSNLYTPFCEDWVYQGHLVKIGKQLYFDIKEAVWHKDFVKDDLDINEEDIHL